MVTKICPVCEDEAIPVDFRVMYAFNFCYLSNHFDLFPRSEFGSPRLTTKERGNPKLFKKEIS